MRLNELITPQIVNTNIKKPHDIAGAREKLKTSATAYASGRRVSSPDVSNAEFYKRNHLPSTLKNDAYNAYIKAIIPLMGGNPYVPEIYKILYVKDTNGRKIPKYKMRAYEKYTRCSSGEILALLRRAFPVIAEEFDDEIEAGVQLKKTTIWFRLVAEINAAAKQDIDTSDEQLNEVLEIIRNVVGSNRKFHYDMHTDNFMIRRTSFGPQLVISDPVQDGGHSTKRNGRGVWKAERDTFHLYQAAHKLNTELDVMAFARKPTQQLCDEIIRRIGIDKQLSPKMLNDEFMRIFNKTPLEAAMDYYR